MTDKGERIDGVIDEVAREMTSVPPLGGDAEQFARHVAERIAKRESGWRPRLLVPAAAACVMVLAVLLLREGNVRLKPDATAAPANASAPANATATPAIERRADATVAQDATAARETTRRVAATPVRRTPPPAVVRPLLLTDTDLAPLTTTAIDVAPLTAERPLEIAAIALDRIEITAMP